METADPRDALVDRVVRLRSVANAIEARSAEIVAELSALDQGHQLGCRSPEQFLSWTAGLSHAPAKALVEVGSRLGELPSLLCHWHHAMLHDGRFVARVVDGRPVVTHAGSTSASRPPPPASAAGIAADPHAARSQYDGGSMDYACFDAAFNQPPAG